MNVVSISPAIVIFVVFAVVIYFIASMYISYFGYIKAKNKEVLGIILLSIGFPIIGFLLGFLLYYKAHKSVQNYFNNK